MDGGGQGLYDYLVEEVDEFIIDLTDAFIEAVETTFSDRLHPFGCHYRVAHCTARIVYNGDIAGIC